jgi:hypothetical protein
MNHFSFLRDAGMVLLAATLTLCTFITMAQHLNPPTLTAQRKGELKQPPFLVML